jgi:hypothetical protein
MWYNGRLALDRREPKFSLYHSLSHFVKRKIAQKLWHFSPEIVHRQNAQKFPYLILKFVLDAQKEI